jgi:hypothetical protein
VRNGVIWVVDWDISLSKDRFRFYRALRKVKKELGIDGEMSTMSVLITQDKELAFRVYDLALTFADRVHIYEAKEVSTRVTNGVLDNRGDV